MQDTAVTKYLEATGIPKTTFLDAAVGGFLLEDDLVDEFLIEAQNDISVTKFLDAQRNHVQENVAIDQDDQMLMIQFLEQEEAENEISVTKFLDQAFMAYLQ